MPTVFKNIGLKLLSFVMLERILTFLHQISLFYLLILLCFRKFVDHVRSPSRTYSTLCVFCMLREIHTSLSHPQDHLLKKGSCFVIFPDTQFTQLISHLFVVSLNNNQYVCASMGHTQISHKLDE